MRTSILASAAALLIISGPVFACGDASPIRRPDATMASGVDYALDSIRISGCPAALGAADHPTTLCIEIVVRNNGMAPEWAFVHLYAVGMSRGAHQTIALQDVEVRRGETQTLVFEWDPTGFVGRVIVLAYVKASDDVEPGNDQVGTLREVLLRPAEQDASVGAWFCVGDLDRPTCAWINVPDRQVGFVTVQGNETIAATVRIPDGPSEPAPVSIPVETPPGRRIAETVWIREDVPIHASAVARAIASTVTTAIAEWTSASAFVAVARCC